MNNIKEYIFEKLHLNKDIKIKNEFKYIPENKSDLMILVKKFIVKQGDNADLSDIDTHRIKDMSYLFYDERSIKNINISNWDTSNVTNMEGMFYNCYKFNSDISSWDVSNVTNMDKMFNQCLEFNQDLNNWKVNDKCSMNWVFSGCNKLKKKPSWFKKIR